MDASIIITYPAKCKDCIFCKSLSHAMRNYHFCGNEDSPRKGERISLKDLVCEKWKINNL